MVLPCFCSCSSCQRYVNEAELLVILQVEIGGTILSFAHPTPQTSEKTILLRRAERLRTLTGNKRLHSQSELEAKQMSGGEIIRMTLIRPISMTFTEPIVLAINLYIGLIYAVLYSYFESFPLVYGMEGYGWSLGVSTLPFISLLVGSLISFAVYAVWNRLVLPSFPPGRSYR